MDSRFPSAQEYSAEQACYPDLAVVDIGSRHKAVVDRYRNEVLSNVNGDCLRLAVFEGEYRWHRHPESDELFLVVAGTLQIDVAGHGTFELTEWQCCVVPAGTAHRTRAIGRTVNLTFERQGAATIFLDGPDR